MANAEATGTGWITMNHRLSITTAALLATFTLPALAQDSQHAAQPAPAVSQRPVQALQDDQGVIELSNRAGESKSTTTVEGTSAPALSDPVATPPAVTAEVAPPPVAVAPSASAEVSAPKGVRQYAVAALAAVGVVVLSLFVLALVRGRRRRLAELANPGRPIDISKRHIILSREMPRELDDDALPEAPPPASIRTPIAPSSSPSSSPLMVAESRTPTVPPSQPRPASKPTSDLAAAMLRATAPPPPPPASQRQWLSQRPAAVAKEQR